MSHTVLGTLSVTACDLASSDAVIITNMLVIPMHVPAITYTMCTTDISSSVTV